MYNPILTLISLLVLTVIFSHATTRSRYHQMEYVSNSIDPIKEGNTKSSTGTNIQHLQFSNCSSKCLPSSLNSETVNREVEGIATLSDGVQLPFLIVNNCCLEEQTTSLTRTRSSHQTLGLIFGHGLGAKSPRAKNHLNDEWNVFMRQITVHNLQQVKTVFYTARGHGASNGWQHNAVSHSEQFQWLNLGNDMHQVASSGPIHMEEYIAGGSSMGSASALYCAINFPRHVKGLIMVRPPTAWEDRKARRDHLLRSSERLRKQEEDESGNLHWLVLRHTAYSDLPDVLTATGRAMLSNIDCPVIILTIDSDDTHPVATARKLAEAIPHAVLHVAADKTEANSTWPRLIASFVDDIRYRK